MSLLSFLMQITVVECICLWMQLQKLCFPYLYISFVYILVNYYNLARAKAKQNVAYEISTRDIPRCFYVINFACKLNLCSNITVLSIWLVIGRKRRGSKPSHFVRSSPSVARSILKNLELLKLVEKDKNG